MNIDILVKQSIESASKFNVKKERLRMLFNTFNIEIFLVSEK